jgi:NADH-quinone oxidoreductase subunit C
MVEDLKKFANYIARNVPKTVDDFSTTYGELTLVTHPDRLERLAQFLRDNDKCLFKILIDICGVDYPHRKKRFDVVYHFLSLENNNRIRVIIPVEEIEPLPTLSNMFRSANWWEREVWDMYGISFTDHPDMRRILSDYDFHGHPLRKDFPLTGYTEVGYDENEQRVIKKPVSLQQDFRDFDFETPWLGVKELLPGDEKALQQEMETDRRNAKTQD